METILIHLLCVLFLKSDVIVDVVHFEPLDGARNSPLRAEKPNEVSGVASGLQREKKKRSEKV